MFALTNKPAILLALCCLPFAPLTVHGQTTSGQTTPQQAETATDGTETPKETEEKEEPTKEEILLQEQQELDALVSGAWVFLAKDSDPIVSTQKARAAAARCNVGTSRDQSIVQSGDVVFARSTRGLQRLDLKSGKIIVFSEHEKQTNPRRGVIWGLRSGRLVHQLTVREAKTRAGTMTVMLENKNIYLRCQTPPQTN